MMSKNNNKIMLDNNFNKYFNSINYDFKNDSNKIEEDYNYILSFRVNFTDIDCSNCFLLTKILLTMKNKRLIPIFNADDGENITKRWEQGEKYLEQYNKIKEIILSGDEKDIIELINEYNNR